MRLTILASGSGGNALLVQSRSTSVFIDAGLRRRTLRQRLIEGLATAPGVPPPSAAFLTHEHADHVAGADDLAAQGLCLYATAGTARSARWEERTRAEVRELRPGAAVRHRDLSVLPVGLPHDAADPVAYVISDGHVRLGVLTDCGHESAAVARAFADCDALVLETNHDRALLQRGPYPPRLKARILSEEGHLSNEQAAALLSAILDASRTVPGLLVCAHLSKTNNRPDLARAAVAQAIGGLPVRLLVAEQDRAMPPIDLLPGAVRPAGKGRATGQLSLPL